MSETKVLDHGFVRFTGELRAIGYGERPTFVGEARGVLLGVHHMREEGMPKTTASVEIKTPGVSDFVEVPIDRERIVELLPLVDRAVRITFEVMPAREPAG